MVRKMLGLDTLDEVQSKVGSDIRDMNSQIVGQRHNLLPDEAVNVLNTDLKQFAKTLKEKRLALKTEAEKLSKTEAEYRVKKQAFEAEANRLNQHHTLERAMAQARERLKGLSEQRDTLDQKITALQQQKEKLAGERTEFAQFENEKKQLQRLDIERQKQLNKDTVSARIAEHQAQIRSSQERLEELAKQLAEKDHTSAALAEKQQAIATAEADIETKRNELREIEKQIGGLNASIRERTEKLASLRAIGQEGTCPTCMQPLLEGYERVVATLDSQIHALQTEALQTLEQQKKQVTEAGMALKTRQTSLRAETDQLLGAQSRLSELARQQTTESASFQRFAANLTRDELILKEIGEVHFDDATYRDLKRKHSVEEARYLEFQKAENYVTRELPGALEALKTTDAGITESTRLVEAKTAELSALNFQEATYLAVKEAFTGFDAALATQSTIVRQLEKEALELQNDIARAEEKLQSNEAIKAQISDKLNEIELLRKLSEHLGNFKTEILEKVSPGISREASDLFSRITKGKYESILVDENFDFSIADGGQYYPIERFSGGEVDLANFCLRIAVTKAIMDLSGSGHRLEFLAFDEIFGSQDEERRLEMMLALNYLQEQFRQIYIVSHIESLRDYFPHLLEVQFAEEGSSAVWR
jgi:exonuclease SbcC